MNDEAVDLLNENGEKTGQVMMKSEAHAKGLWHGATWVWIFDEAGYILFQLRGKTKKLYPNKLDISVAGHIESGHTAKQTAVKEAKEEIDLLLEPSNLIPIGTFHSESELIGQDILHRSFAWAYIYPVKDKNDLRLIAAEHELEAVKWIHIDDFAKDISSPETSKEYVPNHDHFEVVIREVRSFLSKA